MVQEENIRTSVVHVHNFKINKYTYIASAHSTILQTTVSEHCLLVFVLFYFLYRLEVVLYKEVYGRVLHSDAPCSRSFSYLLH